jgi:DNA-binding XRE family transcriptional regulator
VCVRRKRERNPIADRQTYGPLPSATIIGAHISEFVAWDGQQYVLRPTKASVLADESLRLIGSVRKLSKIQRLVPGYVFVENPNVELRDYAHRSVIVRGLPSEISISSQLKKLQAECDITAEKIAEHIGVEPRSIYRHLSGKATPRRNHIAAYEKLFAEKTGRPIRLTKS